MTVKAILSHKGHDVATIEPAATLAAAAQLLAERRIGALVVTGADRRIVGILSERDIVRALAQQGARVLDTPVSEVMTRKVVTCIENETLQDLMERMTAGKFRHLPVVEQGRLVGIISIGDVVKIACRADGARRGGAAGVHPHGVTPSVYAKCAGRFGNRLETLFGGVGAKLDGFARAMKVEEADDGRAAAK